MDLLGEQFKNDRTGRATQCISSYVLYFLLGLW
jgi:hypothetical protein